MSIVVPVYPEAIYHRVFLENAWVDISGYVVLNTTGYSGIPGKQISDLMASVGQVSITLNNQAGTFSPDGNGAPLAGWKKNVPYKLSIVFDGLEHDQFVGQVTDISLDDSELLGDRRVRITVSDWLQYAGTFPIRTASILVDQKIGQAVTALLALMPIQPTATDLSEGFNTFPTVFDGIGIETKAISELSKLTASEFSYGYVKRDGTLRIEAREDRNGLRPLASVQIFSDDSGFLLQEDGSYLLQEDGFRIILDEVEDASFNSMRKTDAKYGDEQCNQIFQQAYPRNVNPTLQVLFTLDEPIALPAGRHVLFRAPFTDPDSGNPINATEYETATPTTDYEAFKNSDGTGTEYTADLTVVATAYADGVDFDILVETATCWLTKCAVRAKGIYKYNPVSITAKNQPSIEADGLIEQRIDQKYQRSLDAGLVDVRSFLENYKHAKTDEKAVHFIANTNSSLMNAFLTLDVGDLVEVISTRTGVNMYAYIQKRFFNIAPQGRPINWGWELKKMLCLRKGLVQVAAGFGGTAVKNALNFGYLPLISNLPIKTVVAEVRSGGFGTITRFIASIWSDDGGHVLGARFDGKLTWAVKYGSIAQWESTNAIVDFPSGQTVYQHLVCARDDTISTNVPHMWINGVKETVVELQAPPASGVPNSELNANMVIGNTKTASGDYASGFKGNIRGVRYYNRILTQAEVDTLYADPTDFNAVTDGLVFQAPCVLTRDEADWINGTITETGISGTIIESLKCVDNIYGARGDVLDGTIGREFTQPI